MKYTYLLLFSLMSNQCIASSEANQWKESHANKIQKHLSKASKKIKDQRLSLFEVVNDLGKYDYQEYKKLIIPEKEVFFHRGGKNIPTSTREFIWLLSNKRYLQVVVAESFVIYAYIINDKNKRILVWK